MSVKSDGKDGEEREMKNRLSHAWESEISKL